jgi:hypothetical protein
MIYASIFWSERILKFYLVGQRHAWFLEFESSALTDGKFCKSIEVSVQSFYKWQRRLKDENTVGLPKPKSPQFVLI